MEEGEDLMTDVDFCIKFSYVSEKYNKEDIRKELDGHLKLMEKYNPYIYEYDLRGVI